MGWRNTSVNISKRWYEFLEDLTNCQVFSFPRNIWDELSKVSEVSHEFSDASNLAYGIAIYIRVWNKNFVSVNLVTGKSRVAPLVTPAMPIMDLSSCVTLSRLKVYSHWRWKRHAEMPSRLFLVIFIYFHARKKSWKFSIFLASPRRHCRDCLGNKLLLGYLYQIKTAQFDRVLTLIDNIESIRIIGITRWLVVRKRNILVWSKRSTPSSMKLTLVSYWKV